MKKLTLLFFFFIIIGCSPEPAEKESLAIDEVPAEQQFDEDDIRASIDNLRNSYMRAAKNKNMDLLMKMAHQNSVMVMPAAESWMEMFQQSSSPIPYDSIQINPVEVVVIDNEWAWEMGKSKIYYTPEGMTEAKELQDTYLMIFRNEGDGWKLYREVASSGSPPSEEEMIME